MLAVATVLLALANGDSRTFTPEIPEGLPHEYHKERVWVHANTKCFETVDDVRELKDFLLTKYECLDFDEKRRSTIYEAPGVGYRFWSLWFEKEGDHDDFECLSQNVTLPNKLQSECIANVYYEPLQHLQQRGGVCRDQGTSSQFWATDILDGSLNLQYRYDDMSDSSTSVQGIILDTDVDPVHVEFQGLEYRSLFVGTPSPSTTQQHGTHVTGSMVGATVGGSKGWRSSGGGLPAPEPNTNFVWYPVCQLGSSCAWSDIEAGYNAAITLMLEIPTTKYVINFSVGGSRTASNEISYNEFGRRIQEAGGFWVTSAGNSASDSCSFAPAFTEYAITVGSYASNQQPSSFSNYGSSCTDTWGPGSSVWSTLPGGGYGTMSGTSMASPNVASIVMNILKEDSTRTLAQIKSYLSTNSEPLIGVPTSWGTTRRSYWNTGC